MELKLATKTYPSYIRNFKIKNPFTSFPQSTPNVEHYINRQQEETNNYMNTMYSIIIEGFKADLEATQAVLASFVSHEELIVAAKKVIPDLPDNPNLHNYIKGQFQDELVKFQYSRNQKEFQKQHLKDTNNNNNSQTSATGIEMDTENQSQKNFYLISSNYG
jgi:hypothetical protein